MTFNESLDSSGATTHPCIPDDANVMLQEGKTVSVSRNVTVFPVVSHRYERKRCRNGKRGGIKVVSSQSGEIEPWLWQDECLVETKGEQYVKIIAPTGSGKTVVIIVKVLESIEGGKKAIIIAPTLAIALNFNRDIEIKGYGHFALDFDNNLCNLSEDAKANRTIEFLKSPLNDVLVCTHSTMVNVFNRLKETKETHLLQGVSFFVDEAHHIRSSDGEGEANKLGEFVRFLFENEDGRSNLCLITATYGRGDGCCILLDKEEKRFKEYRLGMPRHIEENCKGLDLRYNFVLCDEEYFYGIDHLFKQEVRKTFVFIPHPNRRESTLLSKYVEVQRVLESIAGSADFEVETNEIGIMRVKRGSEWVTVVDLVEENKRVERVKYVREHGDEVDVVIGINVPKEGFDWEIANRMIIIGYVGSMTELAQILGRVLRYHPTKSYCKIPVEFFQVFSRVKVDEVDKEGLRDVFNDYMKSIFASLTFDACLFEKVKLYIPSYANGKAKNKKKCVIVDPLELIGIVSDCVDDYEAFVSGMIKNLYVWEEKNKELSLRDRKAVIFTMIVDRLKEVGVNERENEIALFYIRQWCNRSELLRDSVMEMSKRMRLSDIDIELVSEVRVFGFMNGYTCAFGSEVLRRFSKTVYCKMTFEELEAEVVKLLKKGTRANDPILRSLDARLRVKHSSVKEVRKKYDLIGSERADYSQFGYSDMTFEELEAETVKLIKKGAMVRDPKLMSLNKCLLGGKHDSSVAKVRKKHDLIGSERAEHGQFGYSDMTFEELETEAIKLIKKGSGANEPILKSLDKRLRRKHNSSVAKVREKCSDILLKQLEAKVVQLIKEGARSNDPRLKLLDKRLRRRKHNSSVAKIRAKQNERKTTSIPQLSSEAAS